MKTNVGSTDRIIRIVLAVILAALYFTDVVTGTLGTILLILAFVFLVTALFSVCPIYLATGLSTSKKKE